MMTVAEAGSRAKPASARGMPQSAPWSECLLGQARPAQPEGDRRLTSNQLVDVAATSIQRC